MSPSLLVNDKPDPFPKSPVHSCPALPEDRGKSTGDSQMFLHRVFPDPSSAPDIPPEKLRNNSNGVVVVTGSVC